MFKTFSNQFDVVLELATRVENPDSSDATLITDTVIEKLIFKACDVVQMTATDIDLDFATKNTFQTDTAISGRLNGTVKHSVMIFSKISQYIIYFLKIYKTEMNVEKCLY